MLAQDVSHAAFFLLEDLQQNYPGGGGDAAVGPTIPPTTLVVIWPGGKGDVR